MSESASGSTFLYKVALPRFSLILDKDPIREGRLLLPEDFSKEHGAKLSSRVFLKLPDGAEWQVGVGRDGWKTWLHEGWREVAEFYSLALRHLLIFECPTYSNLNVFVFDVTASEVDYPIGRANVRHAESEHDAFDETLGSPSSSPETGGESPPFEPPERRKSRRRDGKERIDGGSEYGGKGKQVEQFEDQSRDLTSQRAKSWTAAQKAAAIVRANAAFESQNPFFRIVIQPSHLGSRLNVPVRFFEENFKDKHAHILLQIANVGEWMVEYHVEDYGYEMRAFFEPELWNLFAQANSLRVDDVCVFELVEANNKLAFNVVISRPPQVANCSSPRPFGNEPAKVRTNKNPMSPGTESAFTSRGHKQGHSPKTRSPHREQPLTLAEREDALVRAHESFKSRHPFFMVVMHPSYIVGPNARLSAPADFFEKNFLKPHGDIVLQLPDVGIWTVKYEVRYHQSKKKALFRNKLWAQFVKDNNLRIGDLCAFELVKGGDAPILNVTISRASQVGPTTEAEPSSRTHGHSLGNSGNPEGKRSMSAFQAAKAFTSNQPFFQLIVTRANLSKSHVSIPTAFWEVHIKEGTRKMELWLGSRFWGVKVVRVKEGKRERMFITGGWISFARENSLVAGNVCVFELVKSEDDAASEGTMVLNVHVFRG